MTLMAIFMLWFAAAYVEYKIIRAIPALHRWFQNPVFGIIISLAIGAAVAAALGIPNGFVAGSANAIGLATNNFTYPMFHKGRELSVKVKSTHAQAKEWKTSHPQVFADLVGGIKAVVKFGAAIFIAIGFVIRIISMLLNFLCHPITNSRKAIGI